MGNNSKPLEGLCAEITSHVSFKLMIQFLKNLKNENSQMMHLECLVQEKQGCRKVATWLENKDLGQTSNDESMKILHVLR